MAVSEVDVNWTYLRGEASKSLTVVFRKSRSYIFFYPVLNLKYVVTIYSEKYFSINMFIIKSHEGKKQHGIYVRTK